MLNSIYQAVDPVIFSFGPFSIRWYGVAYVLGFLCAALVIWRVSKRWRVRVDSDSLLTIMFCVIIGVIVGARMGYVLFYGDGQYLENPLEILAFNKGGMSFHGGLVGALLAGIVAAKLVRIPYLTLADLGCIGAPIGLFFGRCANFINGELWGAPTDAPWGVIFGGSAGLVSRHPSQLYEALLEGVVLFLILFALSRKVPPRPRGTFLGVFLVFYGMARFAIEFVRQPDIQLGYLWGGWLTMGQVLSVPLIVVGAGVLAYAAMKKLPQVGLPVAERVYDACGVEGPKKSEESKDLARSKNSEKAGEPKEAPEEPESEDAKSAEGVGRSEKSKEPESSKGFEESEATEEEK